MGFRSGAYAKVWSVEKVSDTNTKLRVSISRKNKKTDLYEQEFSGFVSVVGEKAASDANRLKEGDRIKLGDVDVKTKYDGVRKQVFYNFFVFNFEPAGDGTPTRATTSQRRDVSDGYDEDANDLPF